MSSYQGIEVSMIAGVDLSIGDFVYEFDSIALDYDISLIMDIYYKLLSGGYDNVSAVPKNMVGISSKLFYKTFNKYSNFNTDVKQESFRIISRRMINRVNSMNKILSYRKAVYSSSGLSCGYIHYNNDNTKSQFDTKEKINRIECATASLIIFTNIIQTISLYISIFFLTISLLMVAYIIFSYFGHKSIVDGWASIMMFLSLSFFGLFFILTLILQYLSVILKLIFKQKQYIIASIEKLTNN